jgi:hypothetical protein
VSQPPHPSGPKLPKLRAGQLREQVHAALAADPTRTWTVTELADALGGRSAGAVGQALEKLAATGRAFQVAAGPRRYRATPTTASAGAASAGADPATSSRAGAADPGSGGGGRGPGAGPGGIPAPAGALGRPGGGWYLPRRLGGATDVEVLQRLRGQNIPVLLYGPPGTGKTALVEAAFPGVLTIAGHGDTVVEDLLGSWLPLPAGGFEYTHGPLPVAMREGRVLFVDDATLIPPRVLAVLYPAMDGRGLITIPAHHHEQVKAAEGFYVIAGHNPGVHGAILTEALASRLATHIEVATDFELARKLGVPDKAVSAAANLNTKLRNGQIGWAPQLRELLAFKQLTDTLGISAAVGNLAAIAPEPDREQVVVVLAHTFGTQVTPLRVGDSHPPNPAGSTTS